MMQYNMRKNIFNTTMNHSQPQEEEIPPRKRNKSLGSRPQPGSTLTPLELAPSPESPSLLSYRKHRIQAKLEKFSSIKAGTELCQENLNIYNSLKKEVTSRKVETIHSTIPQNQRSPMHIPKLGLVPFESSKFKKLFRNRKQLKCKTQYHRQQVNSPDKALGLKIKPQFSPFQIHPLKKYNQLSLQEIIEDESPKRDLNFALKFSDFQALKHAKKDSRRPSDDYSISGW